MVTITSQFLQDTRLIVSQWSVLYRSRCSDLPLQPSGFWHEEIRLYKLTQGIVLISRH